MKMRDWREDWGHDEEKDPLIVATDQIVDAKRLVNRAEWEFLSWPWRSMTDLTGNIPPGSITLVAAFSGGGKTTFVSSLVTAMLDQKKRVYVMALETTPDHFRTYLACQKLGVKPGDVITGETFKMPNGAAVRAAVDAEIERQFHELRDLLRVSNEESINNERLAEACRSAADWKADLVIVDHIDHIEPENYTQLYAESRRTVTTADALSKRLELRLLLTSQLNNSATKGNALAKFQPPREEHFFMGGHKIHVSTIALGLFRPIRQQQHEESDEEYRAQLNAAKAGEIEAYKVLQPGTMGVVQLKSRHHGERVGRRTFLDVSNGRVYDREVQ